MPSTFKELVMCGFSSASSSSGSIWTYDVFLSFRGEDTRYDFTDHLYNALHQSGIHTFRDDNELCRGGEISPELQKEIEGSKISVVVFSKDYASSRWCLDELTKILECRHRIGQVVLPIFYKIDPSDVRKQTGSYAKAFEEHEERFQEEMGKVNKWREALSEAGTLSGWYLNEGEKRYESEFIKIVVNEVSHKLGFKCIHVAKHPVNIDSRIERITSLLSLTRSDVCIVGIHGIAGIGKTTLAKATFNELRVGFDGSSFLSDVKGISDKNALVDLQQQILHDILKTNVCVISNVDQGKSLIRERLGGKRVVVVFDNVDQREELDALMEERSWFAPGSIIIITTRNKHLLTQLEVDHMYHAKEMDRHESLQLFSLHAFRNTNPLRDFQELSNKVVDYCKGLPLALEILGSHLFGRSKTEWEIEMEQWQKIPNNDIHKKLKVSLDALNDDTREMFLDIACFFVGRDKDDVANILVARYDFNPEIAFRTLMERSLITIGPWNQNQLRMHDILRDIGREIIRQKSPRDPGKRNRIWHHKDANDVLCQETGTEVVEGLVLDARASEAVQVSTRSFRKMRSLQLLEINGLYLAGSFKHVSKLLIWLCWHRCPLGSLEPDFQLDSLVILDLQHSNVKELWKTTKSLNKLKILNLSYSKNLIETPNLHSSSLEKLILKDCSSLIEVHQSVGQLKSLVLLNLTGCCSLKILPRSMGDMESLAELLADGTAIEQFPPSMGNLKKLKKLSLRNWNHSEDSPSTSRHSLILSWLSPVFKGLGKLYLISKVLCDDTIDVDFGSLSSLKELDLSYNKFSKLPPGIGHLPILTILQVKGCRNLLSISELPSSLEKLEANQCQSLAEIPQSIGHLKRLVSLNFKACCKLKLLPSGIGHTPLVDLWVQGCTNLQSISELPSSLKSLWANGCTSLESVPIQSDTLFSLRGCKSLKEIEGMEGVRDWRTVSLVLDVSPSLSKKCKRSLFQELCNRDMYEICLDGGYVPAWFSQQRGPSLSFRVPARHSQKLVVWLSIGSDSRIPCVFFSVKIKTNDGIALYDDPDIGIDSRCFSWVKHMVLTNMKGGERLELSVEAYCPQEGHAEVHECGVYLIEEKTADIVEDCCSDIIGQGTASPAPTYYDHLDPWKKYLLREFPNWDNILEVQFEDCCLSFL